MSEAIADIRPIKFWTKYVQNPEGGLREVDWVEFARRGDAKYTTVPMSIKQASADRQIWPALEPHYTAWKNGRKVAIDGTALDAWAGITAEQIDVLKVNDVHTLEDLVKLTDAQRERIGLPGLLDIQRGAQRFLTGLSGGKVETALAEKDMQIQALQQQMADLMALMGKDNDEEPVKRRPGRPPRASEGAEAA